MSTTEIQQEEIYLLQNSAIPKPNNELANHVCENVHGHRKALSLSTHTNPVPTHLTLQLGLGPRHCGPYLRKSSATTQQQMNEHNQALSSTSIRVHVCTHTDTHTVKNRCSPLEWPYSPELRYNFFGLPPLSLNWR